MSEEYNEILISQFPQWLYLSLKIYRAISNSENSIMVRKDIIIPKNEYIENDIDFINMINCCDYFEYRHNDEKYPMSVYAYYFLSDNFSDDTILKLPEKLSEKLPEKFRRVSLMWYTTNNSNNNSNNNSIREKSEKWYLQIQPKLDNISIISINSNLIINKECNIINFKTDKYRSKIQLLTLYYNFYDFLEESFINDGRNAIKIRQIMKFRDNNFLYRMFSRFFQPELIIEEHLSEYSKLIETFLKLHELNQDITKDISELGIEKHKRFFVRMLINLQNSNYTEEQISLFLSGMSTFSKFLENCEFLSEYQIFREKSLYESITKEFKNRDFNRNFYVENYELYEKVLDFLTIQN